GSPALRGRDPAVPLVADLDDRVLHLARPGFGLPAEELGVEALRLLGVGRVVLVPDERSDLRLDVSAQDRSPLLRVPTVGRPYNILVAFCNRMLLSYVYD